jgi:hypothetical protein
MDLLRGIGTGISNAAQSFNAPDTPGQPSFLQLLGQQPEHILRDIVQIPSGVLDYGLARFAEPGAENTLHNMTSAGLLSKLFNTDEGRTALMTSPQVANLAGVPVTQVPRGSVTPQTPGFGADDPGILPYYTQQPTQGFPPQVEDPKKRLEDAQARNQEAQAAYFEQFSHRPQAGGPPGTIPTKQTDTVTPRGPTTSTTYEPPQVYIRGGEPPSTQLQLPAPPGSQQGTQGGVTPPPPPAGRPTGAPVAKPPPSRVPPVGQGAVAPPGGQPAPSPTAPVTPTPTPTAPATPSALVPGTNRTFRNPQTGETFSGVVAGDGKTIIAPDGSSARTWDGKSLNPLPPGTPVPGFPSPAFAEPGAQGGAAVGRFLASPAPVPQGAPPSPLLPGQVSGAAYASPAFGPGSTPPAPPPAPTSAPTSTPTPTQEPPPKEVATPGGPTPAMRQRYLEAVQSDPVLRDWVHSHPELKSLDSQVDATMGYVRKWQDNARIDFMQRAQIARLATPVRTQLNALNTMIDRYQSYITVDPKTGKIPLDVFQDSPVQTELSQLAGGPNSPIGRIISPGGIGIMNPLNPSGPQLVESIPGIAKRQDHPDYPLANLVILNEHGLLAELARATSVSGRLTNYEQQLMKKAYVPTPGIDDRTSAVEKVKNTLDTLKTIRSAIIRGQMNNPVEIADMLRGGAGVGTGSGVRTLGPVESAPRELAAPAE